MQQIRSTLAAMATDVSRAIIDPPKPVRQFRSSLPIRRNALWQTLAPNVVLTHTAIQSKSNAWRHWAVGLREAEVAECPPARSLRLDVCELDALGPFPGFIDDELAELDGCHRHWRTSQLGKARLQRCIRKGRIGLLVQLLNNVSGEVVWSADPIPDGSLVTRQKFGHRGDIRERRLTCRGRDCKGAQFSSSNMLN